MNSEEKHNAVRSSPGDEPTPAEPKSASFWLSLLSLMIATFLAAMYTVSTF